VTEAEPENDSVRVNCFEAQTLEQRREELLDALAAWLKDEAFRGEPALLDEWVQEVLLPWLEIHRYAGRSRYDYPRDVPRKPQNDQVTKDEETIYNYHTNLRQKHALRRRQAAPDDNSRDRYGLKELGGL
jgi:hypothetical protein